MKSGPSRPGLIIQKAEGNPAIEVGITVFIPRRLTCETVAREVAPVTEGGGREQVKLMRFIERMATYLDLLGIPTGRLCPGNLVADVCGYFVAADRLAEGGVDIPGRIWSVGDLTDAVKAYTGQDLASLVLAEEVRPGLTVEEFWTRHANRLLEWAEKHPDWYGKSIEEIGSNIREAQRRLSG